MCVSSLGLGYRHARRHREHDLGVVRRFRSTRSLPLDRLLTSLSATLLLNENVPKSQHPLNIPISFPGFPQEFSHRGFFFQSKHKYETGAKGDMQNI
jgi:hypothetical protein